MKTHYTPKKEKYHIGFEYEFSDDNGETWNNAVIKEGAQIDDIHREYRDCRVYQLRAKHLDRKDIESLGWNKKITCSINEEAKSLFGAIIGGIQKKHLTFYLAYYPDKKVTIRMYNKDNENFRLVNDVPAPIFIGIINNKSELKDILKKIGIK